MTIKSSRKAIDKKRIAIAAGMVILGLIVAANPDLLKMPTSKPQPEFPEPQRTILVSSLEGLNNATSEAKPGDQITVRDGKYNTTQAIQISVRGTAEHPVVITAETIGGVEIEGAHGFYVAGSQHAIIRGFKLTHSQDSSDDANTCNDCINVRFTSNVYSLTTQTNIESNWLAITGASSGVRVDHNTFQQKSTMGNFLVLTGEDSTIVQHTVVDHNVFSSLTFNGTDGGECLEVGSSGLGPVSAYTIIEHNVFDNCNGNSEALSIKSSKNIIRYNTFKNSLEAVVFRHGSDNVLDGNMFFGGNNGIRVFGANHVITNNFLANSTGYPVVVGRGTVAVDVAAQNEEYSHPRNIVIAHNTLVRNQANLLVGAYEGSYAPTNITIANNIVAGSSGNLVQLVDAQVNFSNNILYPTGSASIGDIPETGYVNIDPQLVSSGEIMSPSVDSPAIDAIPQAEAYGVATDINGQIRSGLFDIGADEVT